MLPHTLTNFETKKNHIIVIKPKFNSGYSKNNLPKIKDGTYVINLDKLKSIGTHWIALYVNGNSGSASCNAIYFDSFAVGNILK